MWGRPKKLSNLKLSKIQSFLTCITQCIARSHIFLNINYTSSCMNCWFCHCLNKNHQGLCIQQINCKKNPPILLIIKILKIYGSTYTIKSFQNLAPFPWGFILRNVNLMKMESSMTNMTDHQLLLSKSGQIYIYIYIYIYIQMWWEIP